MRLLILLVLCTAPQRRVKPTTQPFPAIGATIRNVDGHMIVTAPAQEWTVEHGGRTYRVSVKTTRKVLRK